MYSALTSLSPKWRHFIYEAVDKSKEFQNEILIGLSVLVIVYYITSVIRRARSNYPPGPNGLPILGYLPFLTNAPHEHFIQLAKKYGDVFSLRLGSQDVVVLNGAEVIREALSKDEFMGKPPEGALTHYNAKSAFFVNDVHSWREQRRFVVQSMKDLGLGKTKIEGEVQEEIRLLLNHLESCNGQAVDLKCPLSPSLSNNICALVFGKRLDYNNPERKFLDENLDLGNDNLSETSYSTYIKWLKYFPIQTNTKEVRKLYGQLKQFFDKEIQKHRDSFDENNIRDFIDAYFVEMKARQEKDPNTTFQNDTLVANVLDVFAAGSETVRTSILWIIYCMAAFPEVQKRIQREIQEVMGDREPDFQDLKVMPYTQAVIMETQRWKSIVPINLLRYTIGDTTVGGYNIPAGIVVMCNFWGVHHDPRYWLDPDSYQPERFLSEDGKSVVKSKYYFPFSLGKRTCPGETMASMEIFLYVTSMLQKFDTAFPEGFKPTFEAQLAVTYRLRDFKVRFLQRK